MLYRIGGFSVRILAAGESAMEAFPSLLTNLEQSCQLKAIQLSPLLSPFPRSQYELEGILSDRSAGLCSQKDLAFRLVVFKETTALILLSTSW